MKSLTFVTASIILAFTTLLASQITTAEFKGPGSVDASATVNQALAMEDDEDVVLIGWIREQLDDELYLFEDESADIPVEIDAKDLAGLEITPRVKVRLVGEIDEDVAGKRMEVRQVSIVEPLL